MKPFRKAILSWYDANARTLPWRYRQGQKPDPYRVWLSEIMLQQTTVAAVIPYFGKFTQRWPTVHSLAKADLDTVMKEWAGLGYYRRARNLHLCAVTVSQEYKGIFPSDRAELKKLPGIGDYTSAAIMAIAFNKNASVVDANIERVAARYFAIQKPLPEGKKIIHAAAGRFFEDCHDRPGDLAQALMDLGATVCTPKNPRCAICPVAKNCEAREQGIQNNLPVFARKKAKPQKRGHVYWIADARGRILVQRRPETGMLAGMIGLPTSEWVEGKPEMMKNLKTVKTHKLPVVRHGFTHFDLELQPVAGTLSRPPADKSYRWEKPENLADIGFPTLFRKAYLLFRKTSPD